MQGKVPLRERITSTKTLLTMGSLISVFVLMGIGRDVRQLEVIIPAILLFYNASNVYQDVQNTKTIANQDVQNTKTIANADKESVNGSS